MTFKVFVDDNFHYADKKERYSLGKFSTLEAAIEAAQKIVNDYLSSTYRSGMDADELFKSYAAFGEDPFIVSSSTDTVEFSAWDYAKQRCAELCGPDAA
jgi:hypothetical protein